MSLDLQAPAASRVTSGTHLPVRDPARPPAEPRIGVSGGPAADRFLRIGSWVAAGGLGWVVCQRLLPLPGLAWWLVVSWLLRLVILAVATSMRHGRVVVRDAVAGAVVTSGAIVVGAALFSVVFFVYLRGWRPLMHGNFLTQDMTGVSFTDALTKGGVLHAILGSLIEIGIATAITLPLGVGTAVFMTEVGGRFARVVRTVVEAMTALPSIVAGLFIYTVAIIMLGLPRSGLAAGLALGVMMLPIIARASDVVLRVVPSGLREASLALGASRWKTVWHVVLPTARSGLATALILGIARGIGETSPVLITSGAASFTVLDPVKGVMNSLPLYVFTTVRSGVPLAIARGFGCAAALLAIVLVLFITARWLARPKRTKARRLRRPRSPRRTSLAREA